MDLENLRDVALATLKTDPSLFVLLRKHELGQISDAEVERWWTRWTDWQGARSTRAARQVEDVAGRPYRALVQLAMFSAVDRQPLWRKVCGVHGCSSSLATVYTTPLGFVVMTFAEVTSRADVDDRKSFNKLIGSDLLRPIDHAVQVDLLSPESVVESTLRSVSELLRSRPGAAPDSQDPVGIDAWAWSCMLDDAAYRSWLLGAYAPSLPIAYCRRRHGVTTQLDRHGLMAEVQRRLR